MYNWVKWKRNAGAFSEFIYKNLYIGNFHYLKTNKLIFGLWFIQYTCGRCQITYCADLLGDVLTCGLRGEGRRDLEVDLRYGVKKNHMTTLESIELSFF